MKYEDIIEGYTDDLKLMDAIDMLNRNPFDAAKILEDVALQTNNEKTVPTPFQMDPTVPISFPDTLSLSLDWEHQYKSQQDLTNISLSCNGEEQTLEYPYQVNNTYPVQFDVDLSEDFHLTSK
ncbi:MAG: hypothetical protein CL557_13490 [Alphaproteobacteria bacterium]|nr:hypothetical protein [Alphaproteobacteria bacterium]